MSNIALFSIPAYGHTNPMLPVAKELVKRGNKVRFYSFDEFKNKIEDTGAEFISCNKFLPKISEKQKEKLSESSTTEMTLQDIEITKNMTDFIEEEFRNSKPDIIFTDSVCFWGKLNALKYKIPMVVSTSTFAFNRESSKYIKNSFKETANLILGIPKISRKLKELKAYGYPVTNYLSLIQNDNNTDTIVYTSPTFQPNSDSFSDHYCFVGPSISHDLKPNKNNKDRPLIYISLGTVVNNKPEFYRECIKALEDLDIEVIISTGNAVDINQIGNLSSNIQILPFVNQLDILSKADVFITHAGMNSVSESLFMATPMILFPQTGEQRAVARRVKEVGAGIILEDPSAASIKNSVLELLNNSSYKKKAIDYSDEFHSCPGPVGAATFIESVLD